MAKVGKQESKRDHPEDQDSGRLLKGRDDREEEEHRKRYGKRKHQGKPERGDTSERLAVDDLVAEDRV